MLSRLMDKFVGDEILTRAAALAYHSVLAVAPLLLLMVASLGLLNLDMQDQLLFQVRQLMGPQAAQVLASVITNAKQRPDLASFSGWFAALLLLGSASIIFGELQSTLNTIFGTTSTTPPEETGFIENARQFLFRRLFSFGMVIAFLVICIVSLAASAILAWFSQPIQLLANFFVFALMFTCLFKLLPDRHVKFSDCVWGGVLTAILFVLGKTLIGLYLSKTAVGSAYGAAGSLVVLLVWAYYSALIVFAGAELAAALLFKEEG